MSSAFAGAGGETKKEWAKACGAVQRFAGSHRSICSRSSAAPSYSTESGTYLDKEIPGASAKGMKLGKTVTPGQFFSYSHLYTSKYG